MALRVVSDLHIESAEDPLFSQLLMLVRQSVSGDILVFAGDLFDLYVGNKNIFRDRYGDFFKALTEASARGIELHYIEGNHDFQIHSAFAGIRRLKIHSDEINLELEGKKFYIAHGDQVDPSDYKYRIWRTFIRSPLMKTVIAVAPGAWVDRVGQASSERSRMAGVLLPSQMEGTDLEKLRRTYRNFATDRLLQGFDFVVLGHCHDLDEFSFLIGDRTGQYINVGYPRVHGTYLKWDSGESKIRRIPLALRSI